MGNSDSAPKPSTKAATRRGCEDRKRGKKALGQKGVPEYADDTESETYSEDEDDRPVAREKLQQSSWYQKAQDAYDQLVHAIIRPPRHKYDMADLGPAQFTFCGKVFRRKDLVLKNARGQKLCVSHWEPFEIERRSRELPCVVYMHGNSSCRKEAITALSLVLSLGATLVSLDFAGCGKSDGEYVSLGIHEKEDLACVIQYLRDSGGVSKIALWGRSMGAATALLYAPKDSTLSAMICDSPFSSLVALAEGMVETGRKHGLYAPGFLVSLAIRFIRSSVQEKADFDVYDLSPADEAPKGIVPLLLIAAEGDAFIPPTHSQLIYHNYAGPRHAVVVPGDHNSVRPKRLMDTIAVFLANAMQIPDEVILSDGLHFVGQPPWVQQELVERGHQNVSFSPASLKQAGIQPTQTQSQSQTGSGNNNGVGGASSRVGQERDIGVGMNRAMQNDAKDKLYNLLSGGSR